MLPLDTTMLELPTGPADLQRRVAVELLARQSAEDRARLREKAREDPVWFIDYFGFTFDPRLPGEEATLPFLLYDYQRELVREMVVRIDQGRDLLVEKSRDMGVTWVVLAVLSWFWLFRPGFQALLGSRKEDYVDNHQMGSLFGNLAWFIDHLPGWLLPVGFDLKRHRRWMKLVNPANGAAILGESSNPNYARGGRFSVIIMDEAAFWPDIEAVWRSTSQSSPCRILVSTPNGRNYFARLRFSGQIDVLTYHWSRHPHKDQQWFEAEKARLVDPVVVAQELEISYDRSVHGLVYPEWEHVPKGHYPYQEGWPLFVSIDFGIADPTAMIWAQRDPRTGTVRIIDCYSNRTYPADYYIPFVTGEIPTDSPYLYDPEEREMIARHGTWGVPIIYGDPAGSQRSQATGDSVLDVWRQAGLHVVTNAKAQRFEDRWHATGRLLKHLEVNLPACAALDEAITAARFPERRIDTRSTAQIQKPIHNWTSHYRSALEYLAVNLPKLTRRRPPPPVRQRLAYDR